jgi:hypothetical protein
MDGILLAGEYAERLRETGWLDKTKAEADDLEALEKRDNPI